MKLSSAIQKQQPEASPGACEEFITACSQLDETRARFSGSYSLLARMERAEEVARRELERAERLHAAGSYSVDPREVRAYFDSCHKEAEQQREKTALIEREISLLEGRILGSASLVDALESEIKEQESRRPGLLRNLLLSTLQERERLNVNGDRRHDEQALETLNAEVAKRQAALEIAKAVIRQRAGKAAARKAFPAIEAAVAKRERAIDAFEAANAELAAVCKPLKELGVSLPGDLSVTDLRRLREDSTKILNFYKEF